MKNTQKGFIVPLLIAIIVVLAIGGGVYVYSQKKIKSPEIIDQLTTDHSTVSESVTTSTETISTTSTKSTANKPTQKTKFSFQEIPLSVADTIDSMGAPYGDRLLQMNWVSDNTLKIVLAVGITCDDKISGGNYSIQNDKITLTYTKSGNSLANCNDDHKLQYTFENLAKKDYKVYTPYPGVTKPLSLFVPKVPEVIKSSIHVIAPNGGERAPTAGGYLIKWSTTGLTNTDKVYISLTNYGGSVDGHVNSLVLASDIPATQGQWLWNVSQYIIAGNQYKISVYTDLMKYIDSSDNYFSVY